MIEKIRIIYKGDIATSYTYMVTGMVMGFATTLLLIFNNKIGFHFLAIGLGVFSLYGIVKGIMLYIVAKKRYDHYSTLSELSETELSEELAYTTYRLEKKSSNRRRYIWTLLLSSLSAVVGLFLEQKGLIVGTLIPVILFAGGEFGAGLLVEFRLWEYWRRLRKHLDLPIEGE